MDRDVNASNIVLNKGHQIVLEHPNLTPKKRTLYPASSGWTSIFDEIGSLSTCREVVHFTVTLLAKFRGLSGSAPLRSANW